MPDSTTLPALRRRPRPRTVVILTVTGADAVRSTTTGHLVLGHGFLLSDLACYPSGVALATLLDLALIGMPARRGID